MTPAQTSAETVEVDRIARMLMDAWAKAEPTHGVTLHPASYVATFADMARAVVPSLTTLTRERDEWRERAGEIKEALKPFAEQQTQCALGIRAADTSQAQCDYCDDPLMLCAKIHRARAAIRRLDQPASDEGRIS